MATIREFLARDSEATPAWLAQFRKGDSVPVSDFFQSRIVFYPGSGFDGHPVKAFNKAHAAHCFVYVDSELDRDKIERDEFGLKSRGFSGYSLNIVSFDPLAFSTVMTGSDTTKIFFAVFDRRTHDENGVELTKSHGARRIVILFMNADGFDALTGLFKSAQPPFCIVLQDHRCGGNHDKFGRGGKLESLAVEHNVLPKYLLVAENTHAWRRYVACPSVQPEKGGQHSYLRNLWQRKE
jgi:hypothetical protein